MSVNVYLSGDPVHDRALTAFADGCGGNLRSVQNYAESDIAVVFGVFKKAVPFSKWRGLVLEKQRAAGRKTIVLETGYINRGDGEDHHYAAGFDGLNGRADFRNQNSPADRWLKLGVWFKPWRYGQKVVVCGQVPWDASVDFTDHQAWIMDTLVKVRQRTHKPVYFRPHPKAHLEVPGFPLLTGNMDWADVHACVTFNSNAAVEAAIEGVPVFVADTGSMATRISNRSLDDIETPAMPSREQWAYDLAYCQWTLGEFEDGTAWRHLTRP